ncbi:MAG: hypothetical protein Q7L55_07025 [Actinomycetota bacterium]|nr:hypothetical protein [Actinomycetota bacterium]
MTDTPGFNDPAQDDAYRSLFRPAKAQTEPTPEPTPIPEPEPPRAPASSSGTGRLFRSRGAEVEPDSLVALSADEAAHLRTMTLQPESSVAAVAQAAPPAPVIASAVIASPIQIPEELASMATRRRQEPGLAPSAVYILVIGVTLIAGLIDSKVSGAGLGWITGIALLLGSVYCALRVRLSEVSVSVIAPPIAFGIAAITVGQIGQSRAGGALLAWVNNSFFTLADNWFWVIGTTLVCLAIAVARARRQA